VEESGISEEEEEHKLARQTIAYTIRERAALDSSRTKHKQDQNEKGRGRISLSCV
jgi:hypothetical protein